MTCKLSSGLIGAAVAAAAGIAPVTLAHAQPIRTVAEGANIDWSYERNRNPVRYRVGDVDITLSGRADAESPDLITPVLTVATPGHAPVEVEGSPTIENFEHRVTVGRWDARTPYVLFQSYSGGAHCCNAIQLVYPDKGALRRVDLGEWDGGPADDLPTDRNGDGRLDFVFVDNAFLYAFASYAESFAPPVILNVIDGEAVDVSTDASFRPLFEEAVAEQRRACLRIESRYEGMNQNGACAAYVASAARVGRFDQAWAEMLQAHDPDFEWTLPETCPVPHVEDRCPVATVANDSYPDALRGFLVDLDYLER